jgi:hypothetical protein
MNTHVFPAPPGADPRRAEMDQRIDRIGWGLFFILIGGLWLVPGESLPEGTWLTSIGVLLLALNAWRLASGLPIHPWTSIVGAIALLAGIGLFSGLDLPILAIVLILVGVATLARPVLRRGT